MDLLKYGRNITVPFPGPDEMPDYDQPIPQSFFEQAARSAYGMYSHNQLAVGYGGRSTYGHGRRSFRECRDHARGMQDVGQYKDVLDPKRKTGKNKGKRMWNISWDTVKVLQRHRNIIKSKFQEFVLFPMAEAVDSTSRMDKVKKKNKMVINRLPETQAVMQGTGIKPRESADEQKIKNVDDVEYFHKMGGIRLAVEMMMKDGIDRSLNISNYRELEEMLIEDVVDVNACSAHCDPLAGYSWTYVDPARLIIPQSIHRNLNDSHFRGFVRYMKPHDIVASDHYSQITPDQRKEVFDRSNRSYGVRDYYNFFGVPGAREEYIPRQGNDQTSAAASLGLEVLTLYFVQTEIDRYVVGRRKRGGRQFERVGKDFTLSDRGIRAGKRVEEYPTERMYKVSWVVGTDIFFNMGECEHAIRTGQAGERKILWPIVAYVGHEKSLVENAIGDDNDLQMAVYKMRHLIAKIPPYPRMILKKHLLKDTITMGDDKFTMLEMIENFQRDGVMVVDEKKRYSLPGEESRSVEAPIEYLKDINAYHDYELIRNQINDAINRIREGTGINPIVDGTTNQQDMLKSVMSELKSASNSSMSTYIRMYHSMYLDVCSYTGLMLANRALTAPVDLGVTGVADQYLREVVIPKKASQVLWDIRLKIISREDVQMMLQDLYANREMIPADSFYMIKNAIEDGDIKKAQYLMSRAIRKQKAEDHERALEQSRAAAEAAAESGAQVEAAREKTLITEYELKKDYRTHDSELLIKENDEKHDNDLELMKEEQARQAATSVRTVQANQKQEF